MDQTCLICLLLIKNFVNAERLMVAVPSLNTIPLQGTVDITTEVCSLAECAVVCDVRYTCTTIYYKSSTGLCVTVYNHTNSLTTHDNIFGLVYKTKADKNCFYSGYEYIWELDICVRFYTDDNRNWVDANSRCQNEDGSLLIVDSLVKDKLFLPYLLRKYELMHIVRWWIGASDISSEGNFKWVSGQPMIYTNWEMYQPDDHNSDNTSNADCVQYFYRTVEKSFAWFDRTCDTRMASVCENKAFV